MLSVGLMRLTYGVMMSDEQLSVIEVLDKYEERLEDLARHAFGDMLREVVAELRQAAEDEATRLRTASTSRPGMWAVWRAETAGYRWVPGVGFGSWFSCALFAHDRTSTTFTPEQVARVEGLEFVEPNRGEMAKDWLQRQLAAPRLSE